MAAKRKYSGQPGVAEAILAEPETEPRGETSWRNEAGNAAEGGSFSTSRRGFLGSTGLAAIGAIIGGVLPLSPDGGGIPAAHAQAGGAPRPPRRRGRNI